MAKKKQAGIWETMKTKNVKKSAESLIKAGAPKEVEPEEKFVRIKAYESTRHKLKKIAVEQNKSMQDVLARIIDKEFDDLFA